MLQRDAIVLLPSTEARSHEPECAAPPSRSTAVPVLSAFTSGPRTIQRSMVAGALAAVATKLVIIEDYWYSIEETEKKVKIYFLEV